MVLRGYIQNAQNHVIVLYIFILRFRCYFSLVVRPIDYFVGVLSCYVYGEVGSQGHRCLVYYIPRVTGLCPGYRLLLVQDPFSLPTPVIIPENHCLVTGSVTGQWYGPGRFWYRVHTTTQGCVCLTTKEVETRSLLVRRFRYKVGESGHCNCSHGEGTDFRGRNLDFTRTLLPSMFEDPSFFITGPTHLIFFVYLGTFLGLS